MLPNIKGEEAYWSMKQRALQQARLSEEPAYAEIEMPRNSPTGFICAFFATIMGFALIWHIWWMVGLAALGAYATFVVFAWRDVDEYIIPAETVARIDRANRSARSAALIASVDCGNVGTGTASEPAPRSPVAVIRTCQAPAVIIQR